MNRIIVIEFISLDGVVSDPDGAGGTRYGGWAFRHGPAQVAGDKFELGDRLESGVLLLGRRTWQHFSTLWPQRTDEFSRRMNAASKLVVTRTIEDFSAWANSGPAVGDPPEAARQVLQDRDVIVLGSLDLVHDLIAHDLVDEYRLLVFPTVIGTGRRLFADGVSQHLQLVSAEHRGAALLTRYERERVSPDTVPPRG